jgi:hypothetical protein
MTSRTGKITGRQKFIFNQPSPVKGRPAFPEEMVGAENPFEEKGPLYLGTHKATEVTKRPEGTEPEIQLRAF